MMNWEDVRCFLAVADAGTITAAARKLHVDHATVSRRLGALEAALNVRLVDRLPRACRLTAVGEAVRERAMSMASGADGIARVAKSAHAPLTGRVVLSAPPVLVASLFARHLAGFHQAFPNICLSIAAQTEQISLSRRDADIAVRLTRPREAASVARKIGVMSFGFYASAAYPELDTPDRWQFIAFDGNYDEMPQQLWLRGVAAKRPIVCEMNHINEHLVAARSGIGVAGLPLFLGEQESNLVRIEKGAPPFARDIWLIVHPDLRRSPPVRAAMDFVAETVRREPLLNG